MCKWSYSKFSHLHDLVLTPNPTELISTYFRSPSYYSRSGIFFKLKLPWTWLLCLYSLKANGEHLKPTFYGPYIPPVHSLLLCNAVLSKFALNWKIFLKKETYHMVIYVHIYIRKVSSPSQCKYSMCQGKWIKTTNHRCKILKARFKDLY